MRSLVKSARQLLKKRSDKKSKRKTEKAEKKEKPREDLVSDDLEVSLFRSLTGSSQSTVQSDGIISSVLTAVSLGFALLMIKNSTSKEDEATNLEEDVKSIPTSAPEDLKVQSLPDVKSPEVRKYPSLLERLKGLFSSEKVETPNALPPLPERSKEIVPTTKDTRSATKATALGPDYRASFNFPSTVKGSSGLTSGGSYTKDEVEKIINLRSSSANTSASFTMTPAVKAKIYGRAAAYGLDPESMYKVAMIESGGNPNAISSTGAIGIFQLTGRTASSLGVKDRFDVDQNIEAGMQLAVSNSKVLSNLSIESTPTNLYLVHQLGPAAAKEIVRSEPKTPISKLTDRTQSAIKKNYGGTKANTVGEYITITEQKLSSFSSPKTESSSGLRATESASLVKNTEAKPQSLAQVKPETTPALKPAQAQLAMPVTVASNEKAQPQNSGSPGQNTNKLPDTPQSVSYGPGGIIIGNS